MNNKNDTLFTLIKSLSQAEKGYFRKIARRHGLQSDYDYLELFSAIDTQETYDEKAIRLQFKHSKWIKRLPVLKQYLLEAIFTALRSFREKQEEQVEARISNWIENARICFEKRLMPLGQNFLDKARVLALEYELFGSVIEIDLLQAKQIKALPPQQRKISREHLYAEVSRMLEFQAHFLEVWRLGLITLEQQAADGVVRRSEEARILEEILEHPLMIHPDEAPSFKSKIYIYHTKLICHHLLGNDEASFALQGELLDIYRSAPAEVRKNPGDYRTALHNYLSNCLSFGRLSEVSALLQLLAESPAPSESHVISRWESYHLLALMYQCRRPSEQEGLSLLAGFEEGLKNYAGKMQVRRTCGTFLFAVNFLLTTGRYDQALEWIDKYQTQVDQNITPDITAFMKLFYLLCHYEKENFQHLEYMLRNAYYHLRSHERLSDLEKAFLQLIRKELSAPDKHVRYKNWQQFQKQLEDMAADPIGTKVVTGYFDFPSWVQAKLGKGGV